MLSDVGFCCQIFLFFQRVRLILLAIFPLRACQMYVAGVGGCFFLSGVRKRGIRKLGAQHKGRGREEGGKSRVSV